MRAPPVHQATGGQGFPNVTLLNFYGITKYEAGLEDNAAAVNLAVNLLRISVQSIMLFCRDVLQDSL